MAGLPPVATEDAFTAIGQDEAALRPGVERLCRGLGVDVSGLVRYAAGSRPVYAAGDLVLKLFPPVATWPGYQVEATVLTAVRDRLPTPVPQVHAAGDHDGWGYVLMSRLPGVPLDTVWDQLPAGDRDRLAGQLGEVEGWDQGPMRAGSRRDIPGASGKKMIAMSLDNMDVMEWLTSDIVTVTRRYQAMYREEEDAPERILALYGESIRELLDAAMLGSGQLASAEHELMISG